MRTKPASIASPTMSDEPSASAKHSRAVFLGLCDRAAYVREGNTNLFNWNILGLRNVVLSYILPITLDGWFIGFAFRWGDAGTGERFRISDQFGTKLGTINVSAKPASPDDQDALLKSAGPLLQVPDHGWSVTFLPMSNLGWVISKPGLYYLEHLTDGISERIGTIQFAVVDPLPLTTDRIMAIKSEPNAAKAVRIEIGCKHCSSKCSTYAALERSDQLTRQGWIWFQDLPVSFVCECGKTTQDLQYMQRNLHGLLGLRWHSSDQVDFVPLYHTSALRSTFHGFSRLIGQDLREEMLQQYLQENPILFHQFPSTRILTKPRILTSYVADFAIVTPAKELLVVELERTNIRLLKKDGGTAADLSHAFDQVRDWLHEINEHRLAVLDSLKIERDEVSVIRGVVIGGRDSGYDAKALRKLKGMDLGRISFLTYDDLLFALDALIHRVEGL